MTSLEQAEIEIETAWKRSGKMTLEQGLEFGRICAKWQSELVTKERGLNAKGKGLAPILESIGIPVSTAYFWIERYRVSQMSVTADTNPDTTSRQVERLEQAKKLQREVLDILPEEQYRTKISPDTVASGDGIGFKLEFSGLTKDEVLFVVHAVKQDRSFLREQVKIRVSEVEQYHSLKPSEA